MVILALSALAYFGPISQAIAQQTPSDSDAATFGLTAKQAREQERYIAKILAQSVIWERKVAQIGGALEKRNTALARERQEKKAIILNLSATVGERDRAKEELDRISVAMLNMASQLSNKDKELEAYLTVIREGVPRLFAKNNPQFRNAMDRYLAGEIAALKELPQLIDLERIAKSAALEVALNKSTAAEHRLVAALYSDELAQGRATTPETIEQWLRAADLDPDEFWQWNMIARLADDLLDYNILHRAAINAKKLAISPLQKATLLDLYSTNRLVGTAPESLLNGLTPEQAALEIYKGLVAETPENAARVNLLAAQFLQMASMRIHRREMDFENYQWLEPTEAHLDEGERLLAESSSWIEKIRELDLGEFYYSGLVRQNLRLKGDLATKRGNQETRRLSYESALRIAEEQYGGSLPGSAGQEVIQRAVGNLADTSAESVQGVELHRRSVDLAEQIYAADPENSDKITKLWFANTGLGLFARSYREYEIARGAFEATLTLGNLHSDRLGMEWMTDLALPRLAQAEMALGNIDAAQSYYETTVEREAASLSENVPDDEDGTLSSDLVGARLNLADLQLIQGNFQQAITDFRAIEKQIREHTLTDYFNEEDKFGLIAATMSRIAGVQSLTGDRQGFIETQLRLLYHLEQLAASDLSNPRIELIAGITRASLAAVTDVVPEWTDIRCDLAELVAKDTASLDERVRASIVVIDSLIEARLAALGFSDFDFGAECNHWLLSVNESFVSDTGINVTMSDFLSFQATLPSEQWTWQVNAQYLHMLGFFQAGDFPLQYALARQAGYMALTEKPGENATN
ncbi:MAG: hypothetical protein AAFP79_12310 [Pseudomonadota bacterium]